MHPTITQALVAERVRDWRDLAARERLAAEAVRGRRAAKRAGIERSGLPAERTRRPQDPVVADEPAGVAADRQPVGHRAA